jgi:putative transposase
MLFERFVFEMRRAVKIRIYPDAAQQAQLTDQWGAVRFVWNKALHAMSHQWRVHGRSLDPKHDLKKLLKIAKASRRYGWRAEHDSMALQQALINLGKARRAFFEKRARYPRFKSRHGRQSSYHCSGRIACGMDDSGHLKGNGWITLPKMPGRIRANIHRPIEAAWGLKSITVTRSKTGKVFATLLFETGEAAPDLPKVIDEDAVLAGDLGLASYMVTSRGEKIANPRHVARAAKKVSRRQKALSRKKKGSSNRAKARHSLARAHEDLVNARSDFQHKLSRAMVDESQATGLETLRVKNMMKNRRLARAIGDAGWSAFAGQVAYKAAWSGKPLVRIDPWAPSTKLCACCGVRNDSLALKDRVWTCVCGAHHDRDINAAINIRQMAITELRATGYSVRRGNAGTSLEAA